MEERAVDFAKAVKVFGGYSALARRLKVPLSTLHGWHRRDKLPGWRAEQIRQLARNARQDVFKEEKPKRRNANKPRRKRRTVVAA